MTEKEKMIAGQAYYSFGEELFEERQNAKELVFAFNACMPKEVEKRNEILKKLLGKTGKHFFIEPPFRCDYGYNIEIGEDFYANYNLVILDCAPVKIGNNVLLAPNVSIFTAGHPIDKDLRKKGIEYAREIIIGDDVWIGGNTVINPGVTIGSNVVIGAGSVITRDVPDNVVAVGNPCKILRKITQEDKKYYFKNLKIEE